MAKKSTTTKDQLEDKNKIDRRFNEIVSSISKVEDCQYRIGGVVARQLL